MMKFSEDGSLLSREPPSKHKHVTDYSLVMGHGSPQSTESFTAGEVTSARKMVESYKQKMSVPGYEEKVPANVREQNLTKMQSSQKELEELERALQSLEQAMNGK